MKLKNLFFTVIFLLILNLCVGYFYLFLSKENVQKVSVESNLLGTTDEVSISEQLVHRKLPFDKSDFFKAVLEANDLDRYIDYHVYGGVIPHHLLPSFVIADFFKGISNQKIGTVVLIGPDHYEKGDKNIVTSQYAWETEFGIIEPDLKTIDWLVSSRSAGIDENTVLNDHAIYGILPFIKYYIPDAKIVPVLVSGYSSKEEVEFFIENLAKFYDDDLIVVASVDFSHYLNSDEARKNDEETISVIKNFDYDTLLGFNNDFIDSPVSVASVMMMMEKLKKTNMTILQHLNASDITGNAYEETTSYFSIYYH